jgi:hypothetical protein
VFSPEIKSYPELQERKRQIDQRLEDISVPDALTKRSKHSAGSAKIISQASPAASPKESQALANEGFIPHTTKIDTHWDFVIKGKERKLHSEFEWMI